MDVVLTEELEKWVRGRVDEGLYESPSEVVRESLRLLRERELQRRRLHDDLRADLLLGCRDLDRGQSSEFTPAVAARIKAAGRRTLNADAQ